jgi:hypothetical protein
MMPEKASSPDLKKFKVTPMWFSAITESAITTLALVSADRIPA